MPVLTSLSETSGEIRHRPYRVDTLLRLWHLLSLDAPTVAALWACLLGYAAGVRPPVAAMLVLILGTWMVYVSDRLLDAHGHADPLLLRTRHRFARSHWRTFLATGLVVGTLMAWLIITRLSAPARTEDAIIFSLTMLYFVAVHGSQRNRWLPKELVVAILFAVASAVPACSRIAFAGAQISRQNLNLAFATLVFAAVCWMNCMFIERWETPAPEAVPDAVPVKAAAIRTRSTLVRRGAFLALACGAVVAITTAFPWLQPLAPVLLSAMVSALVLFLLDQYRARFTGMQLRIAADLALLTPLIILPLLK